jgi:hypothetical protein
MGFNPQTKIVFPTFKESYSFLNENYLLKIHEKSSMTKYHCEFENEFE